MSFQFHETVGGKRFFEVQLPALITALSRISDALKQYMKPNDWAIRDDLAWDIIKRERVARGTLSDTDLDAMVTAAYKTVDFFLEERAKQQKK